MGVLRAFLSAGVVAGALLLAGTARAQTPEELASARQLFGEALADEEGGRFSVALEKYKRVQGVRDTINVRFRIGAALEGLGKVARAVDAYTAAVALGGDKPGDAAIVRAAQARLDVLRPRVSHLALRVTPSTVGDAEVFIDSEPVPTQSLSSVTVDPGPHVVTATAKGARPFRTEVTLAEGGHVEVPVALEAEAPPPPPQPPPHVRSGTYRTIGLVTGAAGGLLVIGGAIVLALRSSAVSELNDSCPGGNCPASRRDDLQSTRDRAVAEGPIGVAMLATGVAALGAGVVLFTVVGREKKTATRIMPSPLDQGAMLTLVRGF